MIFNFYKNIKFEIDKESPENLFTRSNKKTARDMYQGHFCRFPI